MSILQSRKTSYTETAITCLLSNSPATKEEILARMSEESLRYISRMPYGIGLSEECVDKFFFDVEEKGIVVDELQNGYFTLGNIGRLLIDSHFESLLTHP